MSFMPYIQPEPFAHLTHSVLLNAPHHSTETSHDLTLVYFLSAALLSFVVLGVHQPPLRAQTPSRNESATAMDADRASSDIPHAPTIASTQPTAPQRLSQPTLWSESHREGLPRRRQGAGSR
jgi:hypothetical protein